MCISNSLHVLGLAELECALKRLNAGRDAMKLQVEWVADLSQFSLNDFRLILESEVGNVGIGLG